MAYNEITNRSSPNFWAGGNTIKGITIHWWGDPNQNPTAEGIVNWLCNPASQVSAHFVITGTGRRVWQLVNDRDRAWHALSGNASTLGLELDPRCRPEDYDVAAEVIADLWRAYGKLPLHPHRHWVNTACPGNYDMGRLQALAEAKLNGTAPPVQGDTVNKIPDHDNYYGRYHDEMNRKRGRALTGQGFSREEFRKNFVGKTDLGATEMISDNPEADKAYGWMKLGYMAEKDKWQNQIYTLSDQLKKANEALTAERGEKDKLVKENQKLIEKYSKQDADFQEANKTGNSFLLWLGNLLNKKG